MSCCYQTLLLAQQPQVDVGSQFVAVFNSLLTLRGAIAALLGITIVTYLLVFRTGMIILGGVLVFLMSLSYSENKYADNTLVEPLESIRLYAKPVATALVIVLGLRLLFWPRGERERLWSTWTIVFFCFQTFYLSTLALFSDFSRGLFGIVATSGLCLCFGAGFGKLTAPTTTTPPIREVWAIGGIAFIIANFAQLAVGYGNAILGGRLAGVCGNPQQLAAACVIFSIVGIWVFETAPLASVRRVLAIAGMAILALFVLWSGSRTGAICLFAAYLSYFRLRIGRLLLVFSLTAILLLCLALLFSDSALLLERFRYGDDTRSVVWMRAIDEFLLHPLFGSIISGGEEEPLNVVESGYLRALALLGMLGGLAVLVLISTFVFTAISSLLSAKFNSNASAMANTIAAGAAFIFVVSFFEGFIFGLITIFTAFVYSIGSLVPWVESNGDDE
jgi:hypothetical protein